MTRKLQASLRDRVDHHRIAMLYRNTTSITLGTLLMLALVVALVWSYIPRQRLIIWVIVVLALRGVMEWLAYRFWRAPDRQENAKRWGWWYAIAILPSAVAWGAAAFLLTDIQYPVTLTFVAVCLALRAAGSMVTLAHFLPALYASVGPLVAGVILRYATFGGTENLLTAAVWLLFLGYVLIVGHRQARMFVDTFVLGQEKEKLIEELTRKNITEQEARRKAEQASLSKSQFFAAANHDLRQPLHSLGLFAAALRNSLTEGGRQRDLVDQIMQSIESLELLFDDVLDISKLDAGRVKIQLQRFKLMDSFIRLRSVFAVPAREKGLTLRIRQTNVDVYSDQTLLFRILSNLVSNAIRYTHKGGVLVACRGHKGDVCIEVWDTGIGVPPDQHERIFDEFYQLHNPERDRRKGLGLGLATVKRIVELLGYPLAMRSVPGRGSVFRVVVPRGTAAQAGEATRTDEHAVPDLLAGRTILVIDDEASNRVGMQSLLESWGCRCVTAATAEEILKSVNGSTPDFIIADLRLRDNLTGIDVIRSLRAALGNNIPAVVVSGDTGPERLREVSAAGLTILHKPLKAMRLRALLNHEFAKSMPKAKAG